MEVLALSSGVQPHHVQPEFMSIRQSLMTDDGFTEEELTHNPTVQEAWKQQEKMYHHFNRAHRRFKHIFENELLLKSTQRMQDCMRLLQEAPSKVRQYQGEFPDVPLSAFTVELDNVKSHLTEVYNKTQRELMALDQIMEHWEPWIRRNLDNPDIFLPGVGFSKAGIDSAFDMEVQHFLALYKKCPEIIEKWESEVYLSIRHTVEALKLSVRLRNSVRLSDTLRLHPNYDPKALTTDLASRAERADRREQIEVNMLQLDKLLAV